MSDCRIEETDLPGYWVCTVHRVEMDLNVGWCPLAEAESRAESWQGIAEDLRHRNHILTESLAAHADEIRVLRNTIADLAARLLGAP